jgi:uncharacterized small protein (DUF1192 family)
LYYKVYGKIFEQTKGKPFYGTLLIVLMWSVMSGVDLAKQQKTDQEHSCESCMNSVVLSFSHLQEQIQQLQEEKLRLQMQLDKANEKQKALEKKLRQLRDE